MRATIRLGVLGCANIARSFIRDARAVKGLSIVTVASRDADKARAFAQETQVPHSVGSYEALLADPELDAVYIPLPNSLHAAWAIRAAQAGKHILCEKPLAASLAEAQAMVAAAKRAGVVLLEAYPYWYQPQTGAMMNIIARGDLGRVLSVQASFGFGLTPERAARDIRMKPDLAGGALMDAGCYAVSLVQLAMGTAPERVTALKGLSDSGVDWWTMASFDYGDGRRAQISCAMDGGLHRHATIVGTQGVIETEYLNHTAADPQGHPLGFLPSMMRVRHVAGVGVPLVPVVSDTGSGFAFAAQAFVARVQDRDAVKLGQASRASIDIARTLDAVRESSATGRVAKVAAAN
jgi:predicted dehydrogenase